MFSFRYMSVADIIPGACYGNIIKALPLDVQPPDILTRDYLDSLNTCAIYGSSHNPVIIMTMPANIVAKYQCEKNIITSNTNMVLRMEQLSRISFHVKDKQIGTLESTTPLEAAFTYNGYSWKYVAFPLSGNYCTEIYSCFFILTVLNNIVKIELKTYSIEYHKDLIIKNSLTHVAPLTYLKIKEIAENLRNIVNYADEIMQHPLNETCVECLKQNNRLQEHLCYMVHYSATCPYNIPVNSYGFTANDIYGHLMYISKLRDVSVKLSLDRIQADDSTELWDLVDAGFYIYDSTHLKKIIIKRRWENLVAVITHAEHTHINIDYEQLLNDIVMYDALHTIPAHVFTIFVNRYDPEKRRIWGRVSMIIKKLKRQDLQLEMNARFGSPLKRCVSAIFNSEKKGTTFG